MKDEEYSHIEMDSPFKGDFFFKNKNEKAVIALGGSEGGRLWSTIESKLKDLLQLGYDVLTLAYFREENLPRKLERIPLEYFRQAIDWLSGKEYSSIAVMGLSKGAECALVLASYFNRIAAVAAIVPACVVFQGINGSAFRRTSSWSYEKKELPYVKLHHFHKGFLKERLKGEYYHCYMHSLLNNRNEKAIIPVERIRGPILLLSGKNDTMWPSEFMADMIVKRLKEKQFGYSCEHLVFDTGHDVFEDSESWGKIMDFFKRIRM
ncbi:MAG: hypothetical protein JW881_21410 [Spirochaetales bacterium]|nr:hypothetical protein [Spirochaetales bacterium]